MYLAFLPARLDQAEAHRTLEAQLDLVMAQAETEEVAMVIIAVATVSTMLGHILTCHGKGKVVEVAAAEAAEAGAGEAAIHQTMTIPCSLVYKNS